MASLMAGICRTVGCRFASRISSNTIFALRKQTLHASQCCAYSSTSKKVDQQSEFVIGKRTEVDPERVEQLRQEDYRDPRVTGEIVDPNDPQYEWKGYYQNPVDDAATSKIILFSTLSITLVGVTFYLKYTPDPRACKWARAEALRVIERKRAAGEPIIEGDFISEDKLIVPTDEEMEALLSRKL